MLENITKPKPQPKLKQTGSDSFERLEQEIAQVVTSCRSLISKESLKEGQSFNKHVCGKISTIPESSESAIALEKVAGDMSYILEALKENLKVFEMKQDSFSDVAPEIEKMYQRQSKQISSNTSQASPPKLKSSEQNQNKTPVKQQPKNNNQNVAKMTNNGRNNVNNSEAKVNEKLRNGNNNNNNSNKTSSNSINRNLRSGEINSKQTVSKQVVTRSLSTNNQPRPIVNHPALVVREIRRPLHPPREVYDPLGLIKQEVNYAIKNLKTFTVRRGFNTIRRALLKRGWIEKLHPSARGQINDELKKFYNHNIYELVELLRQKEIADVCRKIIKSKLLDDNQVDLYWTSNYDPYKECSDKIKLTKINKLRRTDRSFTSKIGLADAAKRSFVISKASRTNLNHPRTYSLAPNGDTKGFIKDFHLTAAMSLLKWVQGNSVTRQCKIISPSGKIPLSVFDFAVTECYKIIKKAEDVDTSESSMIDAFDHEWSEFLEKFYKTVHVGNHFKQANNVTETDLVRKATFILEKLENIWPFLDMDGLMNIWILKPVNSSQGVGIHMCRTLNYVLNVVKNNPNRRYIIQKYIERPLLIYNTKFDIRQWFLISSTVPLSIWIYKQCYVRFSSQTYNLRKLHESIHLTNNSVQCRYFNRVATRDITLPSYNMWDSSQFRNYLSDIGFPNVYNDVIYPGMKESIIAAVLLHQRTLDRRKNSFELFGADFMLTEDFKPWLLEINSNPALHASTPITARMCPQVLEDVIKVMVDYDSDPKAKTGEFELAYQGAPVKTADKLTSSNQHAVSESKALIAKTNQARDIQKLKTAPTPALVIKNIGIGMRQTLEDLMDILKKELDKRKKRKSKEIAKKHSIATVASFNTNRIHQASETVILNSCIETQTLSKIKIIEVDSNNNFLSTYHIKDGKITKDEETNTVKFSKQHILNLLKKKS